MHGRTTLSSNCVSTKGNQSQGPDLTTLLAKKWKPQVRIEWTGLLKTEYVHLRAKQGSELRTAYTSCTTYLHCEW